MAGRHQLVVHPQLCKISVITYEIITGFSITRSRRLMMFSIVESNTLSSPMKFSAMMERTPETYLIMKTLS